MLTLTHCYRNRIAKYKEMTIFFITGFISSLLARILFGVFVDKVNFFAKLLTPFTWITVGFGVFMIVFIAIEIYKKLKK